ncbi:NAD-dependent epimerase [Beggiatoa leptomitoformis]|uniref:NAD-dependent epimerase/dehydratase family protein n=1 Tax=Beggiatoa leptomitoformis TaxID=288004 RepID=A0A2N9YIR5_9GAMM|nr:NAD-dependent epimerase [Beggiatoa leptomitoformis]ALG67531.1 NAD-dependent epimerase/dehydratase family protein [Beggiatoa leptomitoformis]AUI70245.1 NAD-dependent epimerase/dehydratase family protein [Beggiatoa leptomitoformis]
MKILVTGAAGFIGFHLVSRLITHGDDIVGLDNLNDYYDIRLKQGRLNATGIQNPSYNTFVASTLAPNYRFIQLNLEDNAALQILFTQEKFDIVVNLAAQAGVRYSLENPSSYISSNIVGFMNLLEACRHHPVQHLVYASSSSVYGLNSKIPFSTQDNTDHPASLYAASKKANELMAHTYSHLYQLPTTGLRFFTVYGEWGRPDMAYFSFTQAILAGQPINIYNNGNMQRDFTYIADIIEGLMRVLDHPPEQTTATIPYRLYNIGNNQPVKLLDFIQVLEQILGKTAKKNYLPMQAGDVVITYADIDDLIHDFAYKPQTKIAEGLQRFVAWYQGFYAETV